MTAAPSENAHGAVDPAFWRGRRVLITGHTGFKGAWLALWLAHLGAEVTGFADEVPTTPSLFDLANIAETLKDDRRGDVRDPQALAQAVEQSKAEVVIHMAAQPMVRRSFAHPRDTYEINVMGTVNLLDAVRTTGRDTVRAVVNVTSDKCYDNRPDREPRPFVETDPMGGHDPYSNSKGCAELVADAFRRSFFSDDDGPTRIASARAGNVIGGGDWGEDRLVPDIIRAATSNTTIPIRNPTAIRPWQHVLNPLSGYLTIAQHLSADKAATRNQAAAGWNFGPEQHDAQPVSHIADRLTALWPTTLKWDVDPGPHPHEAHYLSLDSTKARTELGWRPRWALDRTLQSIVDWHTTQEDARTATLRQIEEFTAS